LLHVREDVHARRVEVAEPRRLRLVRALDEVLSAGEELLVDRLHPLRVERARVLDLLLALAERLALEHAARAELLPKPRILRIVRVLGLLLRVQVIEVAEEFVEAVHRRQVLVAIAEMVLAELAGRVTEGLHHVADGWIERSEPELGARQADLRKTRSDRILA